MPHVVAGVSALQRRIDESLTVRLAGMGFALRGSHGRILQLIEREGVRPATLARGWISKQAIGQRIRELQALGLVVVEHDPNDRRATVVRRTPQGDEVLAQLTTGIVGFERELRDQVGAERYGTFCDVLEELVADHLPPTTSRR